MRFLSDSIRTIHGLAGAAAVALSAVLGAGTAHADPLFQVVYSPVYGSTENTGASARALFTFTDVTANGHSGNSDVLLTIDITNTTNGSLGLGATAATLVALTFDFPTSSPYVYNGGTVFPTIYTGSGASLPPYGTLDVCIRSSGTGNCVGGNPTSGLTAGQSTTVTFRFDTSLTAAALGNLFLTDYLDETNDGTGGYDSVARFQQVNAGGGSDKVIGRDPPFEVPEPATIVVLLAALAALAGLGYTQRARLTGAR